MSLFCILRLAVEELGRIDIFIDVAVLSSHMAQPRIGHMSEVLHIFSYLKCYEIPTLFLIHDPSIGMNHNLLSLIGVSSIMMLRNHFHPMRQVPVDMLHR